MSDVRTAERKGRPVLVAAAWRTSFLRMAFVVPWVCLGIAGVSAVAAAAIYLPLPQGRSVFAPELRSSFALPSPEVDFTETWRERAQLAALSLRAGQDNAWMPDGGLSTLQATRFPNAGRVRFDVAARLPMPRPDGIERQDLADQGIANQDVARQGAVRTVPVVAEPQLASLPPQPKSEPGIFGKLFADPDRAAKAVLAANPNTALYDIARRVVYLPDGDRLEAHSGFGPFLDDPQSVARKDVGVTPPNVYAVSFREKPFHGVRALRMKPVGIANMYGRDGILAHSYLLGEAGASNGCISVRDYDKFVKAYEDGKFNQIIVLRTADEPVPAQVASNQADGT
jgi:hypothetical protein